MRRVHTIHTIRPFVSGTMFATLFAIASMYAIGREVWVAKVFENMPNPTHLLNVFSFFESAFFNTTTVVQILCVATVVAFVWLARDFARGVRIPAFA